VVRQTGTVLRYQPGDAAFREGEPANGMFPLLSGRVAISAPGT
jgi:CRP-like cAMP-binding protein